MRTIDILLSTPRTTAAVNSDETTRSDECDPPTTLTLHQVELCVLEPLVLPLKSFDAIREIDLTVRSMHLYAGDDTEAKFDRSILEHVHMMSCDELKSYATDIPQGNLILIFMHTFN